MGIAYHTAYSPDGLAMQLFDRIVVGTVQAVYAAGTTTGVATAVAVTWSEPIATPYIAIASPVEASSVHFTSRTALGMTVNITPVVLTTTLAGGTIQIALLA
jgi:hypothetical protein